MREGERAESLFELIRANVRVPNEVIGDLQAQIAANSLAARKLVELMRDAGLRDLRALAATIQARSEAAMRAAIAALPDGEYRQTVVADGAGGSGRGGGSRPPPSPGAR